MYPLEGAEEAYQHYPRNRILDKQHQGGSRGRESWGYENTKRRERNTQLKRHQN